MREWIQNYGAMAAAGVAAVLSLLSLVVNLRSKRQEWLREKRLLSYSELAAASTLFSKTLQKVALYSRRAPKGVDHLELAHEMLVSEARFEAALASVLILGPKEVGRVASLLFGVIEPMYDAVASDPGEVPDLSTNIGNFSRVMNAFIEAATMALGERHLQDDVKVDKWLALSQPTRASWP